MTEKIFFKNKKGLTLCGALEEPNSTKEEIVILVHGYGAGKEGSCSVSVADELTKREINNFRIDLSGNGESEGEFEDTTITSWAEDVESAIDFMKKRGYKKIDLEGDSAGGITIMATALKNSEINRLGLFSPVSDYVEQMDMKYGKGYIENWKKKGYYVYTKSSGKKLKVNFSFYEDAKNQIMYDKVKDIKCPVLIVHGDQDESVPLEQSEKIVKYFPNAKLVVLKGANHKLEIDGDRTKAINMFADWFEKGEVKE